MIGVQRLRPAVHFSLCLRPFSRNFSTQPSNEEKNLYNPLIKDDIPIYEGEVMQEKGTGDLTQTYVRPFAWSFSSMMNFTDMMKALARAYRWLGPGGNVNFLRDMSTLPKADAPITGRRFLNREQSVVSSSRNPAQRESAADLFRLQKVKEDLGNYKVPPKQKMNQIYRPTALDGYGGIVESRIIEAMQDFEPPGPSVQLTFLDERNPYIDEATSRAHRMMRENGCLPEWIELNKEIKMDTENFQSSLADTFRRWVREGDKSVPFQDSHRWLEVQEFMSGKIKQINKKILHFNLIVPSINLQKPSLRITDEINSLTNSPR